MGSCVNDMCILPISSMARFRASWQHSVLRLFCGPWLEGTEHKLEPEIYRSPVSPMIPSRFINQVNLQKRQNLDWVPQPKSF